MAFFHNRSINLVNLHYAITAVAMGGGGAFWSVYMIKAGASVPLVLLATAATFALRFVLRTLVLALALRTGLRWLVVIGAFVMGLSFPPIAEIDGLGWAMLVWVVITACADAIYWPSYHAYFAALGDEEHRGQQLGIREAVNAMLGIVSPIVAGWVLVTYGARPAFAITGAIMALGALPLLWTPDVPIPKSAPGAMRAAISGSLLFVGDGVISAGYFIVWQLALFLSLSQNFMAYGGALAIASLVGAVGGLALGRLIDDGKGLRAVWLSVGLLTLVILMRATVQDYPLLAVAANALGALVGCLYIPTLMTAVYNQAKRSPCVLRFHIVAEGGWDVGITGGLLAAAGLVALGVQLGNTILLSLAGAACSFILLGRYYRAHAAELIDASLTQPEETDKI